MGPFLGLSAHFLPFRTCPLFQGRARLGFAVEWRTDIVLPAHPIAFPLKHTYDCVREHPSGRRRLPELLKRPHYRVGDPLQSVTFKSKLHLKRAITRGDPGRLDLLCERL